LLRFETDTAIVEDVEERVLAADEFAVESHVSGNVWQVLVEPGQQVTAGQTLLILESMKMEIEISAHKSGTIVELLREAGQSVGPGKTLIVLKS
ncbi:MAG: acetyl-CoA carboxylase biotin carboxyl carrier protein subunit, partial [Oleibacter sp.]|nr:acetyl-CoA carboxylase biotin carboxyl carrier protein subunit [Thalassolituus sp.]